MYEVNSKTKMVVDPGTLENDLAELKIELMQSKGQDKESQLSTLLKTFDPVFSAVAAAQVSTNYRIFACDTLSVWFSRSTQFLNKNPELKFSFEGLLDNQKATFVFHYVIDFWNDSGAALGNALKEVFLKMLTYLTITLDPEVSNELFAGWLSTALDLPYTMRAFYFMIEHLHKKVKPANFILKSKKNFVKDCLENIWSRALGSVVGKSVFLILRSNYTKDAEDDWLALWQDQVINCLRDVSLRKGIESYLLPNLFLISKSATIKFLSSAIRENDIPILLSTLKVAQDTAILIEPFLEVNPSTNKPLISIEAISLLLKLKVASFRIGAFQLLVSSPKLSKPIPSIVYEKVTQSLDMICMDGDLETRNEMFSYFKKFIVRIKDSTYALHRDATSLSKKNFTKFELEIKDKFNAVEDSKRFLNGLLAYIKSSLRPGSSYLKKEMSYKLLLCLIRSGLDSRISEKNLEKSKTVGFVYSIDIYDFALIRLVIDNITDNFEDIRQYSTDIISMAPLSLDNYIDMSLLQSRALSMLSDIKGKEVDSGARFFKFSFSYYQNENRIEKCEEIIKILLEGIDSSIVKAKENIAIACISYSIQGYFAAFKFIFEVIDASKCSKILSTHQVLDKLIQQSIDIWNLVNYILQHDSPEGFLLNEFEASYTAEQEAMYGKGTQVVLSYAWRSIKESTNMIDSILKAKKLPITDANILQIGPLLLEQLATIRHRGAFSSVYPTFVSCCTFCRSREALSSIPEKWLDENLKLIQTRSKYITRRSAGIPFLLTAILSSDKRLIKPTFYKLLDVAKSSVNAIDADMSNVNLPQVNAFNCIKTIFIDAALSEDSILYVDDAFALTLNSFASPYWAIRNCAVMLFTALQNRLFSSKKVKANYLPSYPARLFFEKFGSIRGLFYETLNEAISSGLENQSEIEKVFPILTVMGRLEPTPGYTGLNDFIPLIIQILKNKNWKVREMAARSLPSMINSSESFSLIIFKLLDNLSDEETDYNKIHGYLLAIRETILKFSVQIPEINNKSAENLFGSKEELKTRVLAKLDTVLLAIDCYPVKLTYLQILSLIDSKLSCDNLQSIETLFSWFKSSNKKSPSLNGCKQLALKQASSILLDNLNDDVTLIEECMFSPLYELQLNCIQHYSDKLISSDLSESTKNILIDSIWKLLEVENTWKYVKSQGLKLLKALIVKFKKSEAVNILESHAQKLVVLMQEESNEDIKLSAVEALGSYVSQLMITNLSGHMELFDHYVDNIQNMISENLEFVIRISALKSLIAFNEIYYPKGGDKKIKLLITGFIFEFLTDDDDFACQLAAKHLSETVLGQKDLDLVPVEVERLMMEHYCSINDEKVLEIFVMSSGFNFYDTKTQFNDIVTGDLLLFSAEKSNLDRNPTDKVNELIKIIKSTPLHENISALQTLTKPLQRNLKAITNYLESNAKVDGCFGLFSSERVFDFVFCQLLLFKCLEKYNVLDFSISELTKVLQSERMHCHPLVLEILG